MRCMRLMKPTRVNAAWTGLAGLLLALLATPLVAQSASPSQAIAYDIREEVTIQGTVSSALLKPASGMVVGSHLLIATPSGPVDASLGRFGLYGKGAVSVAAGQQVEVTGVMKTIGNQKVLLARTVKVGDQAYTIRNQHGVPISPQARASGSSGDTARKGDGQ
jgi:hypothetical protein